MQIDGNPPEAAAEQGTAASQSADFWGPPPEETQYPPHYAPYDQGQVQNTQYDQGQAQPAPADNWVAPPPEHTQYAPHYAPYDQGQAQYAPADYGASQQHAQYSQQYAAQTPVHGAHNPYAAWAGGAGASASENNEQKKGSPMIIAIVAVVVVLIGVALFGYFNGWFGFGRDGSGAVSNDSPAGSRPGLSDSRPSSPTQPPPPVQPTPAAPPQTEAPPAEPEPEKTPEPEPQTPQPEPEPTPEPSPEPEPEPEPEPTPEPRVLTFSEAIFTSSDWLRLYVRWENGTLTVFERDKDSPLWIMEGRDGNVRIAEPSFSTEGTTITMGFPTARTVYRLLNNNTGSFGNENMTWYFETDPSVPSMRNSGTNMVSDLTSALNNNLLLVLRVYWNNGDVTIFYRLGDGSWMMRGRNGSFGNVSATVSSDARRQVVTMRVQDPAGTYTFNSDGSGMLSGEAFDWYYNFSD